MRHHLLFLIVSSLLMNCFLSIFLSLHFFYFFHTIGSLFVCFTITLFVNIFKSNYTGQFVLVFKHLDFNILIRLCKVGTISSDFIANEGYLFLYKSAPFRMQSQKNLRIRWEIYFRIIYNECPSKMSIFIQKAARIRIRLNLDLKIIFR